MEILPTPAHNWWGTPDAQAVQERAAEFIEANFLQESYTNKYGVPNEGPGLAVAVLKTGAFQLTKTGVLGKGDADAILRRHNATLLDPAALGEVALINVLHHATTVVFSWGTAHVKNMVYVGPACKDIFVYWDVGRSDQVLVNKTSSTGGIGTTQQRYRNATFHFRKVEDWRGKY
mmetsp:Transcript_10059/g.26218  ORF Transcript_10059/g.26218 Transcript_10059/m.26218 type:complete len:175 (+) Transcript_10059:219-743(+)|eukprot:CAMPEP_0119528620 /NCGR_PEP_ID=MMETSP1344-20130328/42775_1 /TAXON_ID=236787 /ORGANISM="Florenciella parvula, Strain CCMP2471" /LENGTH=174 /DNA_ID=CAMNT_0007568053 /DNA_START=136 /DNA_END=660 /DNA_ORIENTATION=-